MAMPNKLIAVDIFSSRVCVLILNSSWASSITKALETPSFRESAEFKEKMPGFLSGNGPNRGYTRQAAIRPNKANRTEKMIAASLASILTTIFSGAWRRLRHIPNARRPLERVHDCCFHCFFLSDLSAGIIKLRIGHALDRINTHTLLPGIAPFFADDWRAQDRALGVITRTMYSTLLSASVICSHQSRPPSSPTRSCQSGIPSLLQPHTKPLSKSFATAAGIGDKHPSCRELVHPSLVKRISGFKSAGEILRSTSALPDRFPLPDQAGGGTSQRVSAGALGI